MLTPCEQFQAAARAISRADRKTKNDRFSAYIHGKQRKLAPGHTGKTHPQNPIDKPSSRLKKPLSSAACTIIGESQCTARASSSVLYNFRSSFALHGFVIPGVRWWITRRRPTAPRCHLRPARRGAIGALLCDEPSRAPSRGPRRSWW